MLIEFLDTRSLRPLFQPFQPSRFSTLQQHQVFLFLRSNQIICNMCCWPYADVELEDAPPPKKKGEKEEPKEYRLVSDQLQLHPMVGQNIGFLNFARIHLVILSAHDIFLHFQVFITKPPRNILRFITTKAKITT